MAGFMLQTEGRTWGLKSDVLCLKIRARFFVAAATWWAEGAVVLSSWQVWMKTTAGSLCRCSLKNKADRLVHSWQKQGEGVCLHSWGVVLIRKVLAGGGTSSWWPSVTPCVCVSVKMAAGMFACAFSSSDSPLCHQEVRFDVGLSPLSMAVWTLQSGLWTLPAGLLTTPHCRYDLWPQQGRF